MANRFDITVLPCGCLYDEARGCYEQRCRACQREQWLAYMREYRKRQLAEEAGKLASLPVHSPLRQKRERERSREAA